ncbi:MAG TPA: ribonuclease HII [Polyangiaceae bacterium]|nr:ribonuclease HII [Polyangiaceae bacterium]
MPARPPSSTPRLSLTELRTRYLEGGRRMPRELELRLRDDPRPSARALIDSLDKRRRANRAEGQRLRHMLRYERELWEREVTLIAGVDEAGMSPLAGPVSAAAVVLEVGWKAPHVNDSKQLDPREREELALLIRSEARAYAVAYAEPEEIDRLNIYWAGLLAMRRAVEALGVEPEHLLIDARKIRELPTPQTRIVRGDALSLSIAAASILAKTERDARMRDYDRTYPEYGFAQHKGYPVKQHLLALEQHGPCPIHRRSFAPVRQALGLPPLPPWPDASERAQLSLDLTSD